MPRFTTFLRAFTLVCLGLAILVRAEEPVGETVELPPFVVTGVVIGPQWRYLSIPGFEVISQCSDTETREIVSALWRGPQLGLPPELRPRFSLPMTVVLFNQAPLKPGDLQAFGSVRNPGEVAPHWINLIKRTLDDRESFSLNLWPGSFDYSPAFRFDMRTLLRRRAPAAPAWLNEGLFGGYGIYREGVGLYSGDRKNFVHVGAWWSSEESAKARDRNMIASARLHLAEHKRPLAPSPLLSFVPELAAILEAPAPRPAEPGFGRWASAAALFVRWGLYGRPPREAAQFWRFAEQAGAGPVTEKLFQECFGQSYADVRAELSWYLAIALSENASAPVELAPLPKLPLRDATGAEIARLLGEWQRMEAAALAERFPDIARRYREQAADNLQRGHKNGSRDPRLLASMGLLALDSGEFARAHEFLEAAVAGRVAGPRAYMEAARLRWADGMVDDQGTLPKERLAGVIDLLLAAEQQSPPQASVYGLLATAVIGSGSVTPVQAAALRRGLKFYPLNAELQQRIQTALAAAPAP